MFLADILRRLPTCQFGYLTVVTEPLLLVQPQTIFCNVSKKRVFIKIARAGQLIVQKR